MKTGIAVAICWTALSLHVHASEVLYTETFALATNRVAALQQLVPGTEDHFFFHALHYQTTGQRDHFDAVVKNWMNGRSSPPPMLKELLNRQALLDFERDPKASSDYLRRELGLHFNHTKPVEEGRDRAPTKLDESLIDPARLLREAFRHRNLQGLEDSGLRLLSGPLDDVRRRDLLNRLDRPDFPGLVDLVLADLQAEENRAFGAVNVHRLLLLDQLQELARRRPTLLREEAFVHAWMTRLLPGADIDLETNTAAREAYLDRLLAFARTLDPIWNSIKAHALYSRLEHDRTLGRYDRDLFLEYLRIPRRVDYIPRPYMQRVAQSSEANLSADFSALTRLPPIGRDEPLVRAYLLHFLRNAPDYKVFAEWVEDNYLRGVFAESKIVNGEGNPEDWARLLGPSDFQRLKDRVDVDFAPTNPRFFQPDDEVALTASIKNVDTLLVKVYEINAFNYFRDTGSPLDLALDLDGMVATHEERFTYTESPFLRVERTFPLPALLPRGVYVVELIGGGVSSRALVQKGSLELIERTTPAGHLFIVLDEQGGRVVDATLWMMGQEFKPDEQGRILVPYSTQPGRQPIVVRQGDFAALHHFNHQEESYTFEPGFYVDRESLRGGEEAQLVIRPRLTANGEPADVQLIQDAKLIIESVDRDGVSVRREIPEIELHNDRETIYPFAVPSRLSRITFTLQGRIRYVSLAETKDVAGSVSMDVNGVEQLDQVENLLLAREPEGYVVEVLGKNGEPRAYRGLNVRLKHRDFRDLVHASLQTDEQGRCLLGELPGIVQLHVGKSDGAERTWNLQNDFILTRDELHVAAGRPLRIALARPAEGQGDLSLLELVEGQFARDLSASVKPAGLYAEVQGLPAGDYSLRIYPEDRTVIIRVADGAVEQGHVLSASRALELTPPAALQIESVTFDRKGNAVIQLAHATPDTRVHAVATRYAPEFRLYTRLAWARALSPTLFPLGPPESLYVSGRNIGDEYRYILDRRYVRRFPGNLLERPSLLLNPWSRGVTDSAKEKLAADEALRSRQALARHARGGTRSEAMMERSGPGTAQHDPALEFLGEAPGQFFNLVPDARGRIVIPAAELGHARQLRVLALSRDAAIQREAVRSGGELVRRDVRFQGGLDADKFYAEQKVIAPLQAGETLVLQEGDVTRIEIFDTLGKVYALYAALSGDATLAEFAFITEWPTLPIEEKQRLYAKYACHELHLFLYRHDPEFFRETIRPYLASKRDKTFMDDWLLDQPLDRYLDPWSFNRLNAAEKALLAQRVKEEQASIAQRLRERWELIVPDPDRYNHLFNTAVRRGALERGDRSDSLGLDVGGMLAKSELYAGRASSDKRLRQYGGESPATIADPPDVAMEMELMEDAPMEFDAPVDAFGNFDEIQALAGERREEFRSLYRKLGPTEEWAENNYYKKRPMQQLADLVPVNGFWCDVAEHVGDAPFVSANLAEAASTFTEMMLALAMLDLPFDAPEHDMEKAGNGLRITAHGAAVVFYEEVRESSAGDEPSPLLIAQHFFRKDDRYRFEGNERHDKLVSEEFLPHVVYGAQVVLTNPGSSPRKLDLLLQIPEGAIPVENGFYSRARPIALDPYSTRSVEYYFYFPETGRYPLYPAQAAFGGQRLAGATPALFNVVKTLSNVDTDSWEYIAVHGGDAQVLAYLDQGNLDRVTLDRVAFRYRNKGFYEALIERLRARHRFDETLWSYSLLHGDVPALKQFLVHTPIADSVGPYLVSPVLVIDPVERLVYEHLEYAPLVNPRIHRVGARPTILNNRFREQYERFMRVLAYKPELNDEDRLAVANYMFLQDRIEEALSWFGRVNREHVAEQVQFDYLAGYVAFYRSDIASARAIGQAHRDHPVPRWRQRFVNMLNQIDEIEGVATDVADADSRDQLQAAHASREPALDLKVEGGVVELRHAHLASGQLNLYPMDIELLFSRNPFVQQQSARFAHIRPAYTQEVALGEADGLTRVELPPAYRSLNLMVEVVAGPVRRSTAYYANQLNVQMLENYGQVRVLHAETGQLLPGAYVKVYVRTHQGQVDFYKDGYTDLRGRFDYASVSPTDLDTVSRFALLVLHDEYGAVIREAAPPAR